MPLSDHSRERVASEVNDNIFRYYHPYRDDAVDFTQRMGKRLVRTIRGVETTALPSSDTVSTTGSAIVSFATIAGVKQLLHDSFEQGLQKPALIFREHTHRLSLHFVYDSLGITK